MKCDAILESYLKWIKDNTTCRSIGDGKICNMVTPFMDSHNDHIEIYAIKENNKFILTDDGYTMEDLKMSGLEMNTPKREKILKTIINGYGGVKFENGNLFIEADVSNIGQKKHYLLQAILSVGEMRNLSQENVYSLFKEDVERFFQSRELFYSKDIKITGKTGFDHNIDFFINPSKTKPERLIKTVNTPKKDLIMSAIFSFNDINEARSRKTLNYVFYNDVEEKASSDIIAALESYGVKNIPWSEREKYIDEFSLN